MQYAFRATELVAGTPVHHVLATWDDSDIPVPMLVIKGEYYVSYEVMTIVMTGERPPLDRLGRSQTLLATEADFFVALFLSNDDWRKDLVKDLPGGDVDMDIIREYMKLVMGAKNVKQITVKEYEDQVQESLSHFQRVYKH